eukprot:TRINITY_DN39486_c0_g1_i1.p2 TRINITY_DN39486_c0_g1~~TRINITY_DN39486_c0_g1_i1.p2  ORF type:complete len:266 (+),score=101.02 TRINITY_DN39486_c0_g1_i1:90-887(+)
MSIEIFEGVCVSLDDDYAEEQERMAALKDRERTRVGQRPWRKSVQELYDRPGGYQTRQSLDVRGHRVQYEDDAKDVTKFHGGDIRKTGRTVWDSALVLSKYFEVGTEEGWWVGKRVVELGAGVGVPGLSAAALGADEVVLTDIKPQLPLLRRNAALCGRGVVRVEELCWGDEDVADKFGRFDVVLCADVLFVDEAVPPLVDTIRRLLSPDGVLISCCEHRWDGAAAFTALLSEAGLIGRRVDVDEMHCTYRGSAFHLWRHTWRRN